MHRVRVIPVLLLRGWGLEKKYPIRQPEIRRLPN